MAQCTPEEMSRNNWLDVVPSSNPRPWFPGNMQLCTWALANMAKYSALQNAGMTYQTISVCSIGDLEHFEK